MSMPRKKAEGEPRKTEPRKPLDYWDKQARLLLRAEMLGAELKPKDIAGRLKNTGLGSATPKALVQRITRGSFNFGFALRVLRAVGVDHLDLGHLPDLTVEPKGKGDPPSRAPARRPSK
jgi:hypothetical protein